VMHAGRIFVLERGRIVEQGSHAELVAKMGLYYALWRQQIGENAESRLQGAVPVALIS